VTGPFEAKSEPNDDFDAQNPHERLFDRRAGEYLRRVNEPLALLLCNRGLIATQLKERLEALRYRMVTINEPVELVARAESERAMVVFADLEGRAEAVTAAVDNLRGTQATAHIPVIGFQKDMDEAAQLTLSTRGFAVAVGESAILTHLPLLLERALELR
jgi:hypothetical protein